MKKEESIDFFSNWTFSKTEIKYPKKVYRIKFCPELHLMAAIMDDWHIPVWKLTDAGIPDENSCQLLECNEIQFGPIEWWFLGEAKGAILASGGKSVVKLWHFNSDGGWDGEPLQSLEQKTSYYRMVGPLAIEPLKDGGAILAAGGGEGETNERMKLWCLTSEGRWDGINSVVLKEFKKSVYSVTMCTLGNNRILLAASGYYFESFVKLWNLDIVPGCFNGKPPIVDSLTMVDLLDHEKLSLINEKKPYSWPRCVTMHRLPNSEGILVVAMGSDEDEYGFSRDSGHVVLCHFNQEGVLTKDSIQYLEESVTPIKSVALHSVGNQGFLVSWVSGYNYEKVKICHLDKEGKWDGKRPHILTHSAFSEIGAFHTLKDGSIVLAIISGSSVIFHSCKQHLGQQ